MYKICYVTTLPNTLRFFVIDTAKYLNTKGEFDITLICNTTENFERELPQGIKYKPVAMKRGYSLSGLKSLIDLYRLFKKEKFDLVQYSTANAGVYASIAAHFAKVPIRLYAQWGLEYMVLPGIKGVVFEIIERVICANSTHIQPDSKENLNISIREKLYPASKGKVIGSGSANGVNLERFNIEKKYLWRKEIREKYHISESTFVFGYVGRILGEKGINELFEAIKVLNKKYDNIVYLLVGDDIHYEGIEEKNIDWARKQENIIFAGFSSSPEVYYAAMDCFVFPSYHEGFGTSLIEAEAMGLPIIASDIPGPREAMKAGYTGIAIPSKNAKALVAAMENILNDKEKTEIYARNSLDYVKKYFDQKVLFNQIYENRIEILKEIM